MNPTDASATNAQRARLAGLIYLIVVITGILSLAYVPSQTIMPGNAAATVDAIIANESLFRWGIGAGFVCYLAFLILPLALYRLLAPVGRNAALLMVLLAVVSVPISLLNFTHKLDILSLLDSADAAHVMGQGQRDVQVMLLLESYRNGMLVAKLFWGLWLLPFGWLVFTSRILPRTFGILLMLGCAGYLIDVAGRLLMPGFAESALSGYIVLPASLGEIGICLWLLVLGAREWPDARKS